MREQADKFQREILVIRSQSEESSSSAKFELENSKREMVRLNQIIESLRIELESSKKQASEVIFFIKIYYSKYSLLFKCNNYFFLIFYLEASHHPRAVRLVKVPHSVS